jgi:hypothetical protein
MLDNHDNDNNSIEESVIAKSTGEQEEEDIAVKDAALYNVLNPKKKMTKQEAAYREQEQDERESNINNNNNNNNNNQACINASSICQTKKIVIL